MREGGRGGGGGRLDAAWSKLSWLGLVATAWQSGRQAAGRQGLVAAKPSCGASKLGSNCPSRRDPLLPAAADLSSRAGEWDQKRASQQTLYKSWKKESRHPRPRRRSSFSLSLPPFLLQCIPYHTSQPSPMQQIPHPRLRWSGRAGGRAAGRQSGRRAVIFPHSVC